MQNFELFLISLRVKRQYIAEDMKKIKVLDKEFALCIPEEEIKKQVLRLAAEIDRDYEGDTPVFLVVLNGSFLFAADLIREVKTLNEIHFVKLSSFHGLSSTGIIREVMGLDIDLTGRKVIIVEDIIESGITMAHMTETLKRQNPKSIEICTLMLKTEKLEVDLKVKYVGMKLPNDFLLGYGLDYYELARGLKDIYTLVP